MNETRPDRPKLRDRPRSWWFDHAVALAAVTVATLVRLALDPVLGESYPFVTYLGAVTVIAWFGRTPATVLTLVLGGLLAFYLFVPPRHAFAATDPAALLGMGLYFMVAAVVVAMGDALRSARHRAERLLAEAIGRQEELQRSLTAEAAPDTVGRATDLNPVAEAEERAAREQVATTLESVTDGFMRYDRDWRIVYVNAEAERINRLRRAEMLGQNVWEVFPSVVGTKLETELRRAVAEQVTVEFENHYEPFGRWYAIKGYPAPDGGLTTFIRDITELKAQREALAASEAGFRELADAMPQIVYATDADGRVVFANRQWLEYTGQSNAQTADLGSVVHPDDLDDLTRRWDTAKAAGTTLQAEFRLRRAKDGEYRWFLTRAVPIRDEAGAVVKWFGTSTDIHEQKQTARRLAESEALYRAIAESIDFGVWVCDAAGRNTYASESFLRVVGLTQQQCSDFGWGDALHPDDAAATIAAWQECVRTQGTWDREHRFKGADGQWYHVVARGVPLRDAAGAVIGWAGINLDITRLVQTEREVTRLAAESERQRRLYETVLTNTPDFVYVFSLDHRVLYANDALIRMWGRGHDGAIGKTFLEIGYEPWHAAMHDREIDQVRVTRQPIRGEVPFDGTHGRRLYEYIFVPVIGADGEVEAVAGTTRDVTDRKETERQLREIEERSAFVRRSSGVGFWYCDLPFDVLQWDELVKAHFQLPLDATVTIETFYDRLHPDDRESTRRAIERSIADRTPYNVDYRTVDPVTGAVRWVRAIGRTFYAADGAPTRFDGVTLDVSDQKRAEEQQAFRIRLADTLRPLSDPVDVQAEASRVLGEHLRANRVVYFEIRGDEYVIERDYAAGVRPLAGRYPVAAFGPALLAVLLDGHTVIEPDATTEPDRTPGERAAFAAIQVRGHVDVPLVKSGRFVAGMTVHVSDRREWTPQEVALIEDTAERTWAAVERARAEAALRASEERRRLALDAAELGAWHIDLATNTFTTDERFRTIFAGSIEALTYEQAFAAIHPDDKERVRAAVAAATVSDDPAPFAEEYRVVHPDGSVRWIFAKGRASCEREGPGLLVSFDGTVADITARKLIEDDRERLVGQLQDSDRRKDEFLATLAHELRNPLAPIRSGLDLIRMAGAGGTIEQVRSMMERQLGQLIRLVDDLLDVSRVTSGKLLLRKERVELRAVIDAAVETSRPAIEQAGHHLAVAIPEEPILVDGDPIRLAQVVSNLLTNSARYTHLGGQIRVSVGRHDAWAVVSVADNGIGIPKAMLDAVFTMFTQVDRTLEKTTGGLGIGLSLAKGLVEMHGGTIEARSDGEGRGSEFVVRLPVATSVPTGPEATADEVIEAVPSGFRRVLVVDDNVDAADSLAQLVELFGNEVRTAYDGEAGVEAARVFRPGVVLCDIGMPKVNGHNVARRIRAEPWGRKVVLVALTGWGQEDDRQKSADAGFDLHLVKPVEDTALMKLFAGLQAATE